MGRPHALSPPRRAGASPSEVSHELTNSPSPTSPAMTARGKLILTLLILGLVGFGAWQWWDKLAPSGGSNASTNSTAGTAGDTGQAAELVETQMEVPQLAAPA